MSPPRRSHAPLLLGPSLAAALRRALLVLAVVGLLPASARAQEGSPVAEEAPAPQAPGVAEAAAVAEEAPPPRHRRLVWPDEVRPVGWVDVAVAGSLGTGVVVATLVGSTETPAWTRVNRFDAYLRDGLVAAPDRLGAVRTASDVFLYTTVAYPILVEDFGLALLGDRNPQVLAELLAIDAEAFALTGLVVGITKVSASRQRPYAAASGCLNDPLAPGCGDEDRNRSFMSGHSAMAFTSAGLVCFHQQQLPRLYGSRAAGIGVCGSAMAFATTTAVLRVVGDKHWGTDVLAGAGLGLTAGWLLPWLVHGRPVLRIEGEHATSSVAPLVSAGLYGVELRGSF